MPTPLPRSLESSFAHRMPTTRSHTPIRAVLRAAGWGTPVRAAPPSAAARARASTEPSNAASWRKRLTLCIVMREVGEEEMMMMGYWWPDDVNRA